MKNATIDKIQKKIRNHLQVLYPLYCEYGNDIYLRVSPPREYMGRFDQGKKRWSIDIEDNVTYSRRKQVFVKVNDKENFSFDQEKLDWYINVIREKIISHRNMYKLVDENTSKIPYRELTSEMDVDYDLDHGFEVKFKRKNLRYNEMIKLIKDLKKI